MSAKRPFSSDCGDRIAVDRWLKKKSEGHYARHLPILDSVDEPLQTVLREALQPGEQLRWLIDAPSQGIVLSRRRGSWFQKVRQMWKLTPGWLVGLTGQRLLLVRLDQDGKHSPVITIPIEDILYLERGMLLLFSWIVVHWTEHGIAREETIYYNTVCDAIFLNFLDLIRRAIARCHGMPLPENTDLPDAASGWAVRKQWAQKCNRKALEGLPLKFMNMIPRYGLLLDEQIDQVLYRPVQVKRLLDRIRAAEAPRMVVLRTQAYLQFASEDFASADGSYGLILTFLPLKWVRKIHSGRNKKQCYLHILLDAQPVAMDWFLPFPLEMEQAVRNFALQAGGDWG